MKKILDKVYLSMEYVWIYEALAVNCRPSNDWCRRPSSAREIVAPPMDAITADGSRP